MDGVMVTNVSAPREKKAFPDNFAIPGREGWDRFDQDCVERLNKICQLVSDAKIVISSTWRIPAQTEEAFQSLKDYIKHEGVKGEIIDKTPYMPNSSRGAEIQQWLDDNSGLGVESFVILDDTEDMAHLMDHLILTSHKTGILDKHVDAALDAFGYEQEEAS